MMTKIKEELEKELDVELKAKSVKSRMRPLKHVLSTASLHGGSMPNQQEYQIRSQIKHLDDQIKCVAFLLMQCQIGLENCNDILVSGVTATIVQQQPQEATNQMEIPKICIDQIDIDGHPNIKS